MSEIPDGYCHCGCGKKAPLAKRTDRRIGAVKGQPCRYRQGHTSRTIRYDLEPPNPSGLCWCGCGEKTPIATATSQTYGWVKGQYKKYIFGHAIREDLTGRKVGRITVLHSGRTQSGSLHWWCLCECGNKVEVTGSNLRRGITRSCGCLRDELLSQPRPKVTTHGHTSKAMNGQSSTYVSWRAMWARCTNERHVYYHRYGGRGITICERWKDFQNFLTDMGERPEGKTLDRTNNDGNYEPENCRWATHTEQVRNR